MNRSTRKIILGIAIFIFLAPIISIILIRIVFLPKNGISQRYPYYRTEFSSELTKNNFKSVQEGFALQEVEKIIGKPFEYDSKNKFSLDTVNFDFTGHYTQPKNHLLINYASFIFLVHYSEDSLVVSTTKIWAYDGT